MSKPSLPRRLPVSLLGCVPTLMALLSSAAGADVVPPPASAPGPTDKPAGAEVVTVHATKQDQELRQVPASVALLSDATIEQRQPAGLTGLWYLTPNVSQFNDHPNGALYVRGVGPGEQPRFGGEDNPVRGQQSPISLIVDGLPVDGTFGLAAFDDLLDIDQVELLKGPQGTLYGRNALGGVVDIHSRDPGLHGEVDGRMSVGNDNDLRVSAAGGGPLTAGLGARVAVGYSRSDGSLTNATTGADDTAGWERLQARGKLVWRASDALDLRLTVGGARYQGSTDYWVPFDRRNERETQSNNPGKQDVTGASAALQADWHASADDTLTVIAGVAQAKEEVAYDGDRTANNAANIDGSNQVLTNSLEARWSHRNHDPVSWLAGVFAQNEQVDYDTRTRFSDAMVNNIFPPFNPPQMPYYLWIQQPETYHKDSTADTNSAALFAEGTWQVDPHWGITGGLRVAYERTSFDWHQDQQSTSPNAAAPDGSFAYANDRNEAVLLPKVALSYHLDPERMLFASMVRGYRAGGFNTNATSVTSAQITYDPEFTWNYELGLRSAWLDRALTLDVTGFYIDWRDQQVYTNQSAFDVVRVNASRSHVLGAEAQASADLGAGLSLSGGGGLMQAEYDDRVGQEMVNNVLTPVDYGGNRFAHVPDYTWFVGALYRHASGMFGLVDVHGQGATYVDDRNTEQADPYALLDGKIGFMAEHWSLALFGHNLTDETYVLNSITLPADFAFTFQDATYVRLGSARSFGVEATARW